MVRIRSAVICLALAGVLGLSAPASSQQAPAGAGGPGGAPGGDRGAAEWPHVGGDIGGQRYAPLSQIDKANVGRLKVAWTYRTGDYYRGEPDRPTTAFEASPIQVDGSLYLCTPNDHVIALDPASGAEKWRYDPQVKTPGIYESVCRGVSHWRDGGAAAGQACAARLFVATMDARLIALDAATGKPCADFGSGGAVDLLAGLGDVRPGEYYSSSPPLVIGDRVLTNAFVKDGQRLHAPSGAIRAFSARTGALDWVWDPVPPDRTPVTAEQVRAGAELTRGTPNAWGIMSADPERGLVFVGTGNPSPDHYGGAERADMDHYGTSIVALDAATGQVRWNFQTVHHDLWDYDVGAQPVLYEAKGAAGPVPAVAGATKLGFIFLLNRETGAPLFPVEERPVPQTTVPGEYTSPTQPFPTKPKPLLPEPLTRDSIWGLTFWDRGACRKLFDSLDYQGPFTPPSLKGILEYPGLGGGINWGSVSVDPVRRRLVANVQMAPFTVKLVPRAEVSPDRMASSDLVGLSPQEETPYVAVRGPLLSPWGTPCVPPPWGKLAAFDLDTGETIWERPLGTLEGQAPLVGRFLEWGTPNLGGSLLTGSGLLFIAASMDRNLRALDIDTGKELWRHRLPFAAQSTPVTYQLPGGRQYVVVAAGGHGALGLQPGDALVAFTLED
jgi:quinoprotein glucose dehydrogenase